MIRTYLLQPDGLLRKDIDPYDLAHAIDQHQVIWLDIEAPTKDDDRLLADVLNFHPLAIEDCHSPQGRPKVEPYDDSLFIVFQALKFAEARTSVDTANLNIFVTDRALVTVHIEPIPCVATLQQRIESTPALLRDGPDRLAYLLLDLVVDGYFPKIDELDEKIAVLEVQVFERFKRGVSSEAFHLRHDVVQLRRRIAPQREMLNVLTSREHKFVAPTTQMLFRDVYDHLVRINDTLDTYRDLVSGLQEAYLTQISNQMTGDMKTLSVVATLMLPLSVISGVFGMNFTDQPGHGQVGFWWVIVFMIAVSAAMLIVFRLRKWM